MTKNKQPTLNQAVFLFSSQKQSPSAKLNDPGGGHKRDHRWQHLRVLISFSEEKKKKENKLSQNLDLMPYSY